MAKPKGGRPPKKVSQVRNSKYTIFLSEPEDKKLRQMQEKTGKSPADLFRHGLFDKGIRIPKARLAPSQLMELLTDFKKKSGLIQLLAHREKDFSAIEKDLLMGSHLSLRKSIERLERSVFLSLEKADGLEELQQVLHLIEQVKDEFKESNKMSEQHLRQLDELLGKVKQLLLLHYQFLTLA
ncbi:hypothetical protein ACFPQ1_10565 [Rhodocytophaga aerolata]|nr:hypothetical protein [Rhodocytophaga aerolata]